MLDDETKASIQAVIEECEAKLKTLDPDWEEVEYKEVENQLLASKAMLEDQGSPDDWENAGPDHVKDPESGEIAERLPTALVDPSTGERYTENPFGYAEPDITRPDGADGPSLSPEEVVKKDSSESQAKPGGKKSSGRARKTSGNSGTKDATPPPATYEIAPDMRKELDTPEKLFLYCYDLCYGDPLKNDKDEPIIAPPDAVRDLGALQDFAQEKGLHLVEFWMLFAEKWAAIVGGRYSLGMQLDWEVLWSIYEALCEWAAPEQNEWDEIERTIFDTYSLCEGPVKGHTEEQEKEEWNRVLKAKRQYEDELDILKIQFRRLMSVPERAIKFLDTMFINSPAAEDFIARHAKKGTKYVDLPNGRLQQRTQPEALECFDEEMFHSFVGKRGEKWANQYGMERRVEWRSNDSRKAIKARIEQYDKDGEDISQTGYRKRPSYQNPSVNYGKE